MRSEAERWVSVERELGCLSLHLPSAPLVLAFQQQREEGTVSRNMCMYRSRDRGRVSDEEAGSFACRVPRKVSGRAGESRTCTAGRALQTKHSGEIFRGDFLEGRACRLGGRDI
jgi:hypothetical protein